MNKALRVAALALAVPGGFAFGQTLGIDHKSASCAPASGRLALEAVLPASSQAVSLRVYFRGAVEGEEYFLEMREASPGRYRAVLPRPAPGVGVISYRFVARNIASAESSSSPFHVPVDTACAVAALSAEDRRYAENLVLGRSASEGPVVDFECEGVVAQVAANGDLNAAACGGSIEASSETAPTTVNSAARAGLSRVAMTDRSRRVVSRSRP
jgi:hypothetical protein